VPKTDPVAKSAGETKRPTRERRMAVSQRENVCTGERERERERAFHLQPVFRSKMKEKKKKKILKIVYTQLDVPMLC
jgi:hypothetical protein